MYFKCVRIVAYIHMYILCMYSTVYVGTCVHNMYVYIHKHNRVYSLSLGYKSVIIQGTSIYVCESILHAHTPQWQANWEKLLGISDELSPTAAIGLSQNTGKLWGEEDSITR